VTPLSLDALEKVLEAAQTAKRMKPGPGYFSPLTVAHLVAPGQHPSLCEARALITSLEALPTLIAIARAAQVAWEVGTVQDHAPSPFHQKCLDDLKAALDGVTP
jgi:hypothetical protein